MTSSANRRHKDFVMAALDRYERSLTQYAARLLGGDVNTARDVVQHSFLKLCEQDQQAIEDHVAAWLYTVCRNRAIDLLRGRNSEEQLEPADRDTGLPGSQNGRHRGTNPATIVEEADFFAKLQSLIDELPDTQREVVDLWAQGFSGKEMASITGKNSGAVRIALHRAIRQLRSRDVVRRWLGQIDDETVPVPSPLSDRYRELH